MPKSGRRRCADLGEAPSGDYVTSDCTQRDVSLLVCKKTSKGRIDQGFPQVPVVCFMV
jgi:hypothetical protein